MQLGGTALPTPEDDPHGYALAVARWRRGMWRFVIMIAALMVLGLSVKGYFQQRKDPETFTFLAATIGSGLLISFAAGYVAGRVLRRHVSPAVPGYSLTGSGSSSSPPGWVYALPLVGALAPVGMQFLARSSPQAAD